MTSEKFLELLRNQDKNGYSNEELLGLCKFHEQELFEQYCQSRSENGRDDEKTKELFNLWQGQLGLLESLSK